MRGDDISEIERVLQKGDRVSLSLAFQALRAVLRKIAEPICGKRNSRLDMDADDLVQELFVRETRASEPLSFADVPHYLRFMKTVMERISIDGSRRQHSQKRRLQDRLLLSRTEFESIPAPHPTEDDLARAFLLDRALNQVRKNKPRDFAVLQMRRQGFTDSEIGQRLHIGVATIERVSARFRKDGAKLAGIADEPRPQPVELFFATDRRQISEVRMVAFNGRRGQGEPLSLGRCVVSIPGSHQRGKLEGPAWRRLQFASNAARHVVTLAVDLLAADDFYDQLATTVREADKRDAFVFIHGYNVTFDDAVRTTAQLAYDLEFQGAPILYSWPSEGFLLKYTVDETNVEWTIPHLRAFLEQVAKHSGATSIHLIAHSMGNRALARAVSSLHLSPAQVRLHHVVLTAPDIDAQVLEQLSAAICDRSERVTLYCSTRDRALVASQKLHGYGRAGGPALIIERVDTIDTTSVDSSFLGHSYFGRVPRVITDLAQLLLKGTPPEQREGLIPMLSPAGKYFRMGPRPALKPQSAPVLGLNAGI